MLDACRDAMRSCARARSASSASSCGAYGVLEPHTLLGRTRSSCGSQSGQRVAGRLMGRAGWEPVCKHACLRT